MASASCETGSGSGSSSGSAACWRVVGDDVTYGVEPYLQGLLGGLLEGVFGDVVGRLHVRREEGVELGCLEGRLGLAVVVGRGAGGVAQGGVDVDAAVEAVVLHLLLAQLLDDGG